MQALVIDHCAQRLAQSQIALMKAGYQVTGSDQVDVIEACLTLQSVDLLVVEKHALKDALGDTIGFAEERNPHLATILCSDTVDADMDVLPGEFRSLHCILSLNVVSDVLGQMAQVARLSGDAAFAPWDAWQAEEDMQVADAHCAPLPEATQDSSDEFWFGRLRTKIGRAA